jgi:hypothetical protein
LILHDIYCRVCGAEERNAEIRNGVFPLCCAEPMRWRPFPFHTDVLGRPTFSVALGREVSSTRERDRKMRESKHGFVPVGDPVGGARNQDHMNLGKAFAYPGQRTRRVLSKERA